MSVRILADVVVVVSSISSSILVESKACWDR